MMALFEVLISGGAAVVVGVAWVRNAQSAQLVRSSSLEYPKRMPRAMIDCSVERSIHVAGDASSSSVEQVATMHLSAIRRRLDGRAGTRTVKPGRGGALES